MAEKKKIPCRVCGKLFEPCAYCQSHADVFRWRNFACSRKCATKYINDTIAYRESLKNKENKVIKEDAPIAGVVPVEKTTTTRKKVKKTTTNVIENKNEETE